MGRLAKRSKINDGIFFLPAPTKYTSIKGCPEMSNGIFLGYKLVPGGGWSGEYIV